MGLRRPRTTSPRFKAQWKTRDGTIVPDVDDLTLSNDAIKLDGTVLYADLTESTTLVNNMKATFAAEIYKTYLRCAAKLIRADGGDFSADDGDRIMAVFLWERRRRPMPHALR